MHSNSLTLFTKFELRNFNLWFTHTHTQTASVLFATCFSWMLCKNGGTSITNWKYYQQTAMWTILLLENLFLIPVCNPVRERERDTKIANAMQSMQTMCLWIWRRMPNHIVAVMSAFELNFDFHSTDTNHFGILNYTLIFVHLITHNIIELAIVKLFQ